VKGNYGNEPCVWVWVFLLLHCHEYSYYFIVISVCQTFAASCPVLVIVINCSAFFFSLRDGLKNCVQPHPSPQPHVNVIKCPGFLFLKIAILAC
jgi:hypothetical protein